MEQNSWRLTEDVMMSRHIVNSTRLPSFLPGPKIYKSLTTASLIIIIIQTDIYIPPLTEKPEQERSTN